MLAGLLEHVKPGTNVWHVLCQDDKRHYFIADIVRGQLHFTIPGDPTSVRLPIGVVACVEKCLRDQEYCTKELARNGTSITWSDLRRMRVGKGREYWLNDELMNVYITLIQKLVRADATRKAVPGISDRDRGA